MTVSASKSPETIQKLDDLKIEIEALRTDISRLKHENEDLNDQLTRQKHEDNNNQVGQLSQQLEHHLQQLQVAEEQAIASEQAARDELEALEARLWKEQEVAQSLKESTRACTLQRNDLLQQLQELQRLELLSQHQVEHTRSMNFSPSTLTTSDRPESRGKERSKTPTRSRSSSRERPEWHHHW